MSDIEHERWCASNNFEDDCNCTPSSTGRRKVGDIVEINRRNRTVLAEIQTVGRVGYVVRTLDEAGQTLHRQQHEVFDTEATIV